MYMYGNMKIWSYAAGGLKIKVQYMRMTSTQNCTNFMGPKWVVL